MFTERSQRHRDEVDGRSWGETSRASCVHAVHAEVTAKHQAHGEWGGFGEAEEIYRGFWSRRLIIHILIINETGNNPYFSMSVTLVS